MSVPRCSRDYYTYDSQDSIISVTRGNELTQISYDAFGRVTSRAPRHGAGTITLTYSGDRLATRKVGSAAAVSFAHDSFARMTTDAAAGSTLKVKYTYLADGTKVSALKASGAGLVYRGPFTYRRSSSGTLSFESAPFDRGRLTGTGTRYHVTDHLGSVRAVWDGLISTVSLRDGFTGQEDQSPDFTIGYIDFGARQYNPTLSRWLVPDPMGEKYYDVSPYAYCNNDPVRFVDPTGEAFNPIFNREGVLLGTDDRGLQGEAIIMDTWFFHQGMSFNTAQQHNLGMEGLFDETALNRFNEIYTSLDSRPDWDGYLTLNEANDWYRNGKGQPLYVSLDKIDLSGLTSLGEAYIGQRKVVNLFYSSMSLNDALVYGQLTLKRYPHHSVKAYSDIYDFDMKTWWNPLNWGRNIETLIGKTVAGKGTSFEINIYGTSYLSPFVPWVK